MSSSAAKWREEQVLVLCPGSQTTMAQLGCGELTPPAHRIPTRMFRDGDEWRPYHSFSRSLVVDGVARQEWLEDVDADEGAVYPMQGEHRPPPLLCCVFFFFLLLLPPAS